MTSFLARIVLSIALLAQGVGAIASEIGAVLHPHCQMGASNAHGKPMKMPCCHGDECTLPGCADGCATHGAVFIVASIWRPLAFARAAEQGRLAARELRSSDSVPPLRPPIA